MKEIHPKSSHTFDENWKDKEREFPHILGNSINAFAQRKEVRGFDWILGLSMGHFIQIIFYICGSLGEIETKTYIFQVQVHVNHKQFDKLKVSLILTWVAALALQKFCGGELHFEVYKK